MLRKPTVHLGMSYQATRWLIAGWLTLSTILNVIDRQTLAVLAPVLQNRFHISVQGYAHIVAAFMVAYSLMYTFGGRFVDWAGERIGMGACILWWSVCTMLTSLTTGALSLGIIRFLLGLGEPGNYPAALRATTRWFPREERGLPIALFSSGSAVGNTMAVPLIAFVAMRFGWRAAFVVPGSLGLLWLAGWMAVYGHPSDDPCVTPQELHRLLPHELGPNEAARLPSWHALLKNRNVVALVFARFLSDPVSYFYSFWIPEYLMRERGFSLADIGRYAWIPFVAGALGGIIGGRTSDVLIQRGMAPGKARRSVLYFSAALGPLAVFTAEVKTAVMAIVLMSIMAFVVYCWFINTAALIPDIVPERAVGSVLGVIGTSGSAAGVLFTLLVGVLLGRYHNYKIVFFLIGSMHVLGAVVLWSLSKDSDDPTRDGSVLRPVIDVPLCRVEAHRKVERVRGSVFVAKRRYARQIAIRDMLPKGSAESHN